MVNIAEPGAYTVGNNLDDDSLQPQLAHPRPGRPKRCKQHGTPSPTAHTPELLWSSTPEPWAMQDETMRGRPE